MAWYDVRFGSPYEDMAPEDPTAAAARAGVLAELSARQQARIQAESGMRQGMGEISAGQQAADAALRGRTATGMGEMGAGYDRAGQYLTEGGQAALRYLQGGYGAGAQAMGQGYGGARQAVAGMGGATNILRNAQLGQISQQGLGAGYTPSPGYDFARQQAMQAIMGQASAAGGRGGGNVMRSMAGAGQQLAAQDYQDYAARAMAAKQMQVGALGNEAARMDAMRQAQAMGIAETQAGAGTGLAGLYGIQGQGMSQLANAIAAARAGGAQRYGSQALGGQQAIGSQLANIYGTSGANIAAALTGQSQLGANLATGIDRSALVSTAGGAGEAMQGGARDLAQLAMLSYLSGGR